MKKTLYFLLFTFLCSAFTTRPPLRSNKDYALFFAVNDYAPNSGFEDLSKPIENAEAVAQALRTRYGFQTEVVKNPTLDQISAKLREYQAFYAKNPQGKYPSNGQLLIYFSGHGIAEDNNGYFVPADGDAKKLYSTAFAYEIWRPTINKIDCRHILVAIDACYSVTFDPDWYNRKMNPGDFKRPNELSEGDKLLLTNESDKSRILFTSDGSEDKVPERSNFARKFIEGLQNGPRQDGILTSEGLAGYLRFASPKPRLTNFGDDEKGSFLFVATAPASANSTKSAADLSATDALAKDLQAWKAAKTTNTVAAYTDYLNRFPNAEFQEQAQAAIRAIEQDLAIRRDDLAWQVATEKNTKVAYEKYLADYGEGRHRVEATNGINALENQTKGKAIQIPLDMTVEKVIQNYLRAINASKLAEIKDLTTVSKIESGGSELIIKSWQEGGTKIATEMSMNNQLVTKGVYDGTTGSELGMGGATRSLGGKDLEDLKEQALFCKEATYLANGYKLALKSIEDVNGSNAYAIEVIRSDGKKSMDFYDMKTSLKVREITYEATPKGETTEITADYGDYKPVQGVLFRFSITVSGVIPTPMKVTITDIKVNFGIDPAKFKS